MQTIHRDTELIKAAIDGDGRARERLLSAWLPQVLAWCRRLSGPKVDPDDILQDVAEKVLTKMHTLREPAAFPGWLYQVVRSQANRHRRKAWLRRWVPGQEMPDAPDLGPTPERRASRSQLSQQIAEVLERMPEAQREIVVLCFVEDRSHSEVAELLNLPLGTVKSRMRLARARFEREARFVNPELIDPATRAPVRANGAH